MVKVYKYPLQWAEAQTLRAPITRPLTLRVLCDVPTLWALVDASAPSCDWLVHMIPTGAPLPESPGNYLGTLRIADFIFHFFMSEVKPS